MAATPALQAIQKTRLGNLKRVIKEKFDGNTSECARKVERSHTFMWQLVDGYRGIGEKSARHIEQKLKLIPGSLDAGSKAKTMMARTVPVLMLGALDAKPKVFARCPEVIEAHYAKLFCTHIEDSDVVELHACDRVFVDRTDIALKSKGLYVVKPRGVGKVACVLLAQRDAGVWYFKATGEGRAKIAASECKVLGRLLLIERVLAA